MSKAKKGKVIFRKEYDPYLKQDRYYAIFPDDPANYGNLCFVSFHFCEDMVFFDPYDEMSMEYYWKTKVIHKDDPIIPQLYEAIKTYYDEEFQIAEKVMQTNWRR